jgi:hypothetical protein
MIYITRRRSWPRLGIEFERRCVRLWLLVVFVEVRW